MDPISSLVFLSSGLFLGWSLGANDASNVFGSAVASRMVRFSTAAFLCSLFVVVGAITAGTGATDGLGQLGEVNALAGGFTTALAAAITVFWMTRLGLPVSSTQAVVGAIVGWNWFSGSITDLAQLARIVATWVFCPVLAGLFAALLQMGAVALIRWRRPHLLRLDANLRTGLIIAGIFGSYSLGANNIGNVMGVFTDSSPFHAVVLPGGMVVSSVQQLFLLGGCAIAVGVYTYSRKVMLTVGGSLMTLSPLGALVVVLANSLVLFLFSSTVLSQSLVHWGLPPIPLIPVSSSQAVVGAVIGLGLLQGGRGVRQIRWGVLARIASGWVTTPLSAALIGFLLLFVVQNVFNQQVFRPVAYQLSPPVLEHLAAQGVPVAALRPQSLPVTSAVAFRRQLRQQSRLDPTDSAAVLQAAEILPLSLEEQQIRRLDRQRLSTAQLEAIRRLEGRRFRHAWQFEEALARESPAWAAGGENSALRKAQIAYLERVFRLPEPSAPTP
ncbi:inorganic phosphate transporter [Synechococcus sp. CS-1328]|uniref:inorganic phosphate transporter n=1 Tax=Synechococcus sp. CS-1328 TaxID=2847976 RepID=UPI00223B8BD5|nr:inorganic phosphate transporter [Synechococcus sp. CS-1328]MCT0225784.1 inorganic phosphate transporter [Synechococcus sp. CS-1328]MCT0225817.1 inorganic phosphate transporter [Synechococcus sp. CS-1328]